MELRHLRYFVTVADTLNYRRAADRLRVAQPALSKQIKDLERHIGAQLLNRNTGGVSLTDAGAVFQQEALDILERAEMAVDAAREAQDGRRGRLRIGSIGAMSATFLPLALSKYRDRFPKVEVSLEETSLQDQIPALKAGSIQVGFTIDSEIQIDRKFDTYEVLRSNMAIAMGQSHPLAKRSSPSLSEFSDEQFYYFGQTERHDVHRRRMEAVFTSRGIRHRPIKRVSSLEALFTLVAANHGFSIVLPLPNNPSNIVYHPIKEEKEDLEVRLFAIWLKDTRSQLAKNFVDTLKQLQTPL